MSADDMTREEFEAQLQEWEWPTDEVPHAPEVVAAARAFVADLAELERKHGVRLVLHRDYDSARLDVATVDDTVILAGPWDEDSPIEHECPARYERLSPEAAKPIIDHKYADYLAYRRQVRERNERWEAERPAREAKERAEREARAAEIERKHPRLYLTGAIASLVTPWPVGTLGGE